MKYILIDTCSLVNLIDNKKFNPQIEKLDFWIKEKLIEIIVPDIITLEWNEHKENEKKRIHEQWNTKQKHYSEIARLTSNFPMIDYNVELEFIDKQIDTLDNIIQNSPNKISVPNDVKLIIPDKQLKPKKAPFHHKDDSTKDAYLYFSTLEFCKNNGINELYFFSDNSSDFGKALPDKKGSKTEIHPDLLIDYPSVQVKYFGEIGQAIYELSKELPSPVNNDTNSDINKSDDIYIDKENSLLEQIQNYISIVHKELSFVPIHFFIRNYPFKLSASFIPYYQLFTLTTDNEELFSFFENVEIINGYDIRLKEDIDELGSSETNEKIKKVLKSLNQNLIFNISSSKSRKEINIRLSGESNCDCPKCCLRKLRFTDFFSKLNTYEYTIEDLKEKSYLLYKFGNYIEACENVKLVHELAVKEKAYSTAFIAQHNLSKLSIFIRNNYWGENQKDDLIKELSSINLSEISKNYENKQNIKIVKWIRDNEFFTKSKDKILSSVSKIQDNYYKQLNGGWSSNSEVWNLINTYAELDSFLNNNYIIYDKFQEFEDLSNSFFEGIFASHAISETSGSSRLNSFDDWIMSQLVFNGNADKVNKLINRYKIEKIKYTETSTSGETLTDIFENFFKKNINLREEYLKVNEKGNSTFWRFYNKIFCNLITIIPICDFENLKFENLTQTLLEYLETESYLNPSNYKYVKNYFIRLENVLSNELITRYFSLALNNPHYHSDSFFYSISDILITKQIHIEISEIQFESILNIAFEECRLCKEKHPVTFVIPFWIIIKNGAYRTKLSERISEELAEKFNLSLFCLASLYDIIEFDEKLFDIAIELSYPKENQLSFKSAFSGYNDKRYSQVIQLINLCFKNEIDTSTDKFKKFKELDNYYSWLLNMDEYDYSLFEPNWITENPTKFYFKKISQSEKTKIAVESYLRNAHDPKLERIFLNIFILKTWDE